MDTMISADQTGYEVQVPYPPAKIISLVPSQTEFLFDIGLRERICGITRFCIHPEGEVKNVARIGGTKQFDIEKIKSIAPDLIIGNKEENYPEGIESLRRHFPVWMSDIITLEDAMAMMRELSRITGKMTEGEKLVNEIMNRFHAYRRPANRDLTAAYFIWRKPYMVAASKTFIHTMLEWFGVKNVFTDLSRYPEINAEELSHLRADFIFLSTEPYRFTPKHFDEFRSFSPASKICMVDGEMFSWYGSRLLLTPRYFAELQQMLNLQT